MTTDRPDDPLYRALLGTLHEGFIVQDRDGHVVFANPAASRILGVTEETLLGTTSQDREWSAEFEDRAARPDEHPSGIARRTGRPVSDVVMRVSHPGGRVAWVSINASPVFEDADETPSGVVVSFTDITDRREIANQLKDQTERFELVFGALADPMVFFDPETLRLLDVNDATCAFYGYDRSTLIGMPLAELAAEPDVSFADLDGCREPGWVLHGRRVLHRHRDGTRSSVDVSASTITHQGHRVGFAIFRDVTARVRAEADLRREHDHNHALVAALRDGLIESDVDGRITDVSDRFCTMTGYHRDQLLGCEFPYPFLAPERVDAYQNAFDQLEPYPGGMWDLVVGRTDGTTFPAQITVSTVSDTDGSPWRMLGVVRDLTEVSESEAKFRLLADNSTDLITRHDAQLRCTYASPASRALTGYAPEELIGTVLPDHWHPDDLPELVDRATSLEDGPDVAVLQYRIRRQDGSYTWFESTVRVVRNGDGSVLEFQGSSRDVSVRRASEQALREAELGRERRDAETERHRLEVQLAQAQRLDSLGRLAGGVAHDFNNLLGVILNYAGFVAKHLEPNSPVADDVQEIQRAAERAAELTRQLLLFGRKEVVRAEDFDLGAMIEEATPLLRRSLGNSDLRLRMTPAPAVVHADRGQIEQVLMNLLLNARDAFTSGPGTITVTTQRLAPAAPGQSPMVELIVSDDGCGMTAEVVAQAFEPFFTTKGRDRGSGLGLASVHGIATRAGGDVIIDSCPGRGTSLHVRLPAAASDVALRTEATSHQSDPRTILVVDDDREVRTMVSRILREHGYEVIEAANGHDALRRLDANQSIDVLVTDVVMPEMSGRELAERMSDDHPAVDVLFMSGYAQDVFDGDQPAAFIEKPFTEEQLLRSVSTAHSATKT